MTTASTYSLAELMICAAAQAWRDDGEVLATGIGVIPRLAASLSMLDNNPRLMMTDSEAYMVAEPVPVGARNGYVPKRDSWMGFSRIFDNVWSGKRHAMIGPIRSTASARPTSPASAATTTSPRRRCWACGPAGQLHQPCQLVLCAQPQPPGVRRRRVRRGRLGGLQPRAPGPWLVAGRHRHPPDRHRPVRARLPRA